MPLLLPALCFSSSWQGELLTETPVRASRNAKEKGEVGLSDIPVLSWCSYTGQVPSHPLGLEITQSTGFLDIFLVQEWNSQCSETLAQGKLPNDAMFRWVTELARIHTHISVFAGNNWMPLTCEVPQSTASRQPTYILLSPLIICSWVLQPRSFTLLTVGSWRALVLETLKYSQYPLSDVSAYYPSDFNPGRQCSSTADPILTLHTDSFLHTTGPDQKIHGFIFPCAIMPRRLFFSMKILGAPLQPSRGSFGSLDLHFALCDLFLLLSNVTFPPWRAMFVSFSWGMYQRLGWFL